MAHKVMAAYRQRVIALTKRKGHTFGFMLRVEQGEAGHLVRSLDMGGPAELAGMKDGDRILRVNGNFVDGLSHQKVVDLVKQNGVSVTFHVIDNVLYNRANLEGYDLSDPHPRPVSNGVGAETRKAKLCYLVKSTGSFGFSIRSLTGEQGVFMTQVTSGGMAEQAGFRDNDRLLEINRESVEGATHEQVVEKIKDAGSHLMFLLADEDTYRFYLNRGIRVEVGLATLKHLPHKPRIVHLTRGPEGYGYRLKEDPKKRASASLPHTAHFITDIDRGSPAELGGLRDMDRLVAVDGQDVDGDNHEQVVDKIRQGGNKCCLLLVDEDTDNMYKRAGVSPMLFWEDRESSASPPSYTEAIHLPAPGYSGAMAVGGEEEEHDELKPKLCWMQKNPEGYGFHLNGIQGLCGQHIKEVVRGGVADRAGLENGDIVVEVNTVNVENSTHEQVVDLIRRSGSSLELLVARKIVYDKLKAKGVAVTAMLLGPRSAAQVHTTAMVERPAVQTRERFHLRKVWM
ncbi:hypothetical protein CRUP_026623 [Coryphaenoides rupestris]|nr:hypothetical protein CRUP_026623 [Coryphaenoides rupestris]